MQCYGEGEVVSLKTVNLSEIMALPGLKPHGLSTTEKKSDLCQCRIHRAQSMSPVLLLNMTSPQTARNVAALARRLSCNDLGCGRTACR